MNLATIERIKEVKKHENADRLDIVKVLGYDAIVGRDELKVDDLVIFVQPDSILPDEEWALPYKKFCPKRIKAQKLRGVWSYGLVIPLSIFGEFDFPAMEGIDVTDALGITKYEKEVKDVLNVRRATLPYGMPKTDEQRWQNFRDPLPFGEKVDITLKIDGESFTVYCKLLENDEWDLDFGVTSRNQDLRLDSKNKFTELAEKYDLENKLITFCQERGVSIALRGERYGQGSANRPHNPHSKLEPGVMFFSVFNLDTLEYENKGSDLYYQNVCAELDLPTVPLLAKDVELTEDLITYWDNLPQLDGNPFEGVVIKHSGGSFKVVSKHYDAKD